MSVVAICHGTADHLPDVMTIMRAAFDPRYGEAWTANQCLGLLALPGAILRLACDDQPVGFALARIIAGESELMMLGVSPRQQRSGIGRLLLAEMIEEARGRGAATMFLEVRAGNPAIALYTNAAFVKMGTRARYYRGNSGEIFDAETHRLRLI